MKTAFKKTFLQKGFSPIIIVVILALIGVGAFVLYNNSRNSQQSSSTSSQLGSVESNNYYNPIQGVKFVYPSDFQKTEYNDPSIIHAMFVKKPFASLIFLTNDKDTLASTTVANYNQLALKEVSNSPSFKLLDQKDVTINGQQYHQITYLSSDEKNNNFKTIQIWTLTNKKAYGFSYTAVPDQFDAYLPQAQKFFDSITLF